MAGRQISPAATRVPGGFRGKDIAAAYSGWAYVALIYAIGGRRSGIARWQIAGPSWYEWLVIPMAFALS